MSREFFNDGTPERVAWAMGKAVCPECRRYSCRGQCGCGCQGCRKTPLEDWDSGACDVIREMRAGRTPEGLEAQRKAYRDAIAGVNASRSSWGECAAQVERAGCPHLTAAAARKPEQRRVLDGAKRWWTDAKARTPLMLLTDETGTGKSVAAAHVAMKFAESRQWWVSQPSGAMASPLVWMVGDELATRALLSDDDYALIQRAERAEFLVIDEVGCSGAKAGLLALGQLIARRADSGRLTVVTTNAAGVELAQALGAHVVDRLKTGFIVKTQEKSGRGRPGPA